MARLVGRGPSVVAERLDARPAVGVWPRWAQRCLTSVATRAAVSSRSSSSPVRPPRSCGVVELHVLAGRRAAPSVSRSASDASRSRRARRSARRVSRPRSTVARISGWAPAWSGRAVTPRLNVSTRPTARRWAGSSSAPSESRAPRWKSDLVATSMPWARIAPSSAVRSPVEHIATGQGLGQEHLARSGFGFFVGFDTRWVAVDGVAGDMPPALQDLGQLVRGEDASPSRPAWPRSGRTHQRADRSGPRRASPPWLRRSPRRRTPPQSRAWTRAGEPDAPGDDPPMPAGHRPGRPTRPVTSRRPLPSPGGDHTPRSTPPHAPPSRYAPARSRPTPRPARPRCTNRDRRPPTRPSAPSPPTTCRNAIEEISANSTNDHTHVR